MRKREMKFRVLRELGIVPAKNFLATLGPLFFTRQRESNSILLISLKMYSHRIRC
jgi:hypothetical protein